MRTEPLDAVSSVYGQFLNFQAAPKGEMIATCLEGIRRSSHLRYFLLAFIFMIFPHGAVPDCQADWVIDPNVPQFGTASGSFTVDLQLAQNSATDPTSVSATVAIAANQDLDTTLNTIAGALKGPSYGFQNVQIQGNGTTVTFSNIYGSANQKIMCANVVQGMTGETVTIQKPFDPTGVQQIITFAGTLGGVNAIGGAAFYTTAFGYDGFSISSNINYASLMDQTVDGLLNATYQNLLSQLSPSMQGDLSLDLGAQSITLTSPDSITNPYTTNGTDDTSIISSCEVCLPPSVPEPSSIALVLLGMTSLSCAACYRKWRAGQSAIS